MSDELPDIRTIRASYDARIVQYDAAVAALDEALIALDDQIIASAVHRFMQAHSGLLIVQADYMQALAMREDLRLDRIEQAQAKASRERDVLHQAILALRPRPMPKDDDPDDSTGVDAGRRVR